MLAEKLNLRMINPPLVDMAARSFEERDALGFICVALSNEHALALVYDNLNPLKEAGMYEECLAQALTGTRTNNSSWSPWVLEWLFSECDLLKLRTCGDPLPGTGPFVVFRGVSGMGRRRIVRGLSWTADLDVACWFAMRHSFDNWKRPVQSCVGPAVYVSKLPERSVYFFTDERKEKEFVGRPARCSRLQIDRVEMEKRADRRQNAIRAANLELLSSKTHTP
jgi:hypothetical protein